MRPGIRGACGETGGGYDLVDDARRLCARVHGAVRLMEDGLVMWISITLYMYITFLVILEYQVPNL